MRKLSVEKRVLVQCISTTEIWLTLPASTGLIAISCFWVAPSLSLKTRVTAWLVPRSYYSARPMRPGSLGPTCIDQEGLERRRTGPRQSKCSGNNFHLSWTWMKRKHLAIIWCESRFELGLVLRARVLETLKWPSVPINPDTQYTYNKSPSYQSLIIITDTTEIESYSFLDFSLVHFSQLCRIYFKI